MKKCGRAASCCLPLFETRPLGITSTSALCGFEDDYFFILPFAFCLFLAYSLLSARFANAFCTASRLSTAPRNRFDRSPARHALVPTTNHHHSHNRHNRQKEKIHTTTASHFSPVRRPVSKVQRYLEHILCRHSNRSRVHRRKLSLKTVLVPATDSS